MKKIALYDHSIAVKLTGWDMFWAFKRSLSIPLLSVTKVYLRPQAMKPPWLRAPGTCLPGVIIAGTYMGAGRKEFWSCRVKQDSLVMDLAQHEYSRVVLDTPDASKWIEAIEHEITKNPPTN